MDLRKRRGLSQAALARRIGVDIGTPGRWERGEQAIRDSNVPHLAEALGESVDRIWRLVNPEGIDQSSTVGFSAPGLAAVDPSTGQLATPVFAEQLLGSLGHYAELDNLHGPVDLIPLLVQQTNHAIGLIRLAAGENQRATVYAAARLAEFTGWLYQDAGDPRAAMEWTNAGLDLATEAADHYLVAYMWMRKANVALDARRPTMAIEFAGEGMERGRRLTPKLRASTLRVEAQALAMRGDYDGCARAIERAFVDAASPFDAEIDLASYCSTAYIEMEAANCWLELGRPGEAIQRLEAELQDWDPRFKRDKALSVARLAQARAKAGDVDAGFAAAREAINLNSGIRSARVHDRLLLVVTDLDAEGAPELADELRSDLADRPIPPDNGGARPWI